jgi:tetratricopeptide (TPR) repeat protein
MMLQSVLLTVYCVLPSVLNLNPPEIQDLLQHGLEFAYVEEFDSAATYFDKIIECHPENPAGYFFKAALLQVKMLDRSRYGEEEEYLSLMRAAIHRAEDILQQESNLWARFYLGSSYTYRAVYEGLKGNYWETFNYGVRGGRILQDIIKEDSTFYDAYLGAGSYEYFWARASRYLLIPNLGGGNVPEAIRKLHVAAEKSLYSGPTAKNSLVFIYGEEKMFESADAIISELRSTYPRGKTFLWSSAELDFKKQNYRQALQRYAELFSRYEIENTKNYANLAQTKLYMGKCYVELGEKANARAALKDVINYREHANRYPKIKDYSREAYGLLSRIF